MMADFTPEQQATLESWGYKSGDITCTKPSDEPEYYPNPTDPSSFYQCSNGVPYLQPCPAGLVFNPTVNPGPVCDWPSNIPELVKLWYSQQGITIE